MAPRRVTGVVWWEMRISHYKAIFRRARHGEPEDGYTKDLLQSTADIEIALNEMFEGDPPYEPLTYLWPGGSCEGKIFPGSDRLRIGQWTAGGAPTPWRIGDPSSDPLVTLEGNPNAAIPDEANAQWERLKESEPRLVMVQLDGDPYELHLRAYLGSAPPHLSYAGLDAVPKDLRVRMNGRDGLTAGSGLPELWFDPDDFRDPWRTDPPPSPVATASTATPASALLGSEYKPADETAISKAPEPFDVDPDERDRGTQAHSATQNEVSRAARARGFTPRSPKPEEPKYDVAWDENGVLVVVEVKSVTAKNSERQLRLAFGQVLRYRNLLKENGRVVRSVIALSAAPHDERWIELCEKYEVGLIWAPDLREMLNRWLD